MEKVWRSLTHADRNSTILYNMSMDEQPKRIAIVEDDPDQLHNYYAALKVKGFRLSTYRTRDDAWRSMQTRLPDLVILDIVLGHEVDAGFQLCRDLLSLAPQLPILFLTERVDEIDKISGLRMGAWDYQAKPISLDYLVERVASLLRLSEIRNQPRFGRVSDKEQAVMVGQLRLEKDAMRIFWNDEPVDLTMTEYRMIERLVRDPEHAISYESLMQATLQTYVTNNTINTHLRNIRNKFRSLDHSFDCIKNEYGFGYRWVGNS